MPIELKEFQKSLIYDVKAPITNVIADLQEIASLDKFAELQQKKYSKQALYYFLGAVVAMALIFAISIFSLAPGLLIFLKILFFLALLICIVFCTFALGKRARFARLNVKNYRYEVAKKVVLMLSRDMDGLTDIEVRLSFNEIHNKENKIATIPHPNKPKWNIDKHQHEWLKLKGQFLDKTRFTLTATGISNTKYGWKRSISGKNKYKTKTQSLGLDIILHLTYPQRRYGAVKILQNDISHAVKLPKLSYMRGLELKEKSIDMIVRIAPQVEDNIQEIYQTITMMLLSLYQILNLAKLLSK